MNKALKIPIGINRWAFYMAAVSLLFICLAMSYEVVMRYVFNKPTIWSNEVTGFTLVFMAFFGAPYTLFLGGHVNVDALTRLFPKKGQQVTNLIMSILALVYMTVLLWQGWQMTATSYRLDFHSSSAFGPPLYIPQIFIPIGALLLLVQQLIMIGAIVGQLVKKD